MRTRIGNELFLIDLLAILVIIAVYFSPFSVLRIVFGLPFVLFFPGYTLVAALYPSKDRIGGSERIALSFGLSIAVVALTGLILNYMPSGINLETILYSTATFIFVTSAIAWFRRKGLPEEKQFSIEFNLVSPAAIGSTRDRALSAILVIAIAGMIVMIGYGIATPKLGETFTEFYTLGLASEEELKIGEEGKVILGITNNEYATMTYRVEIRIDGSMNSEIESIVLQHDETWEEEVTIIPEVAGYNHKFEFVLYRNEEEEPYLEPLRLWLDVSE